MARIFAPRRGLYDRRLSVHARNALLRPFIAVGRILLSWGSAYRASALATSWSAGIPTGASVPLRAYDAIAGAAVLDQVQRRLLAGVGADLDRLGLLVRWTRENVVPQYAGPRRVVSDGTLGILRRGWGYCDQSAHVLASLAHLAGHPSRLLFLRDADGRSPHTVAEVRAGGKWIVVDAWIGRILADAAGRPLGVDELSESPAALTAYEGLVHVDVSAFQRATRIRAFPYGDGATILRALRGLRADARASRPDGGPRSEVLAMRSALLGLDDARREHLDGRYAAAASAYRAALASGLPADTAEAARYFLALALLRGGRTEEAVTELRGALELAPESDWEPSIRERLAEAHRPEAA